MLDGRQKSVLLSNVDAWQIGDILVITELNQTTGSITGRATAYFIDNIIIWKKIGMISAKNEIHFSVPVPNVPLTFAVNVNVTVAGNIVTIGNPATFPAYAYGDQNLPSQLNFIEFTYVSASANTYVGYRNTLSGLPNTSVLGLVRYSGSANQFFQYNGSNIQSISGASATRWYRIVLVGNEFTVYTQNSNGTWTLRVTQSFSFSYPVFCEFGALVGVGNIEVRNFISQ